VRGDPTSRLSSLFCARDSGADKVKSDQVFALVSTLLEAGVPVNGVGFQLHVDLAFSDFAGVASNLARLGGLGLAVHFTEVGAQPRLGRGLGHSASRAVGGQRSTLLLGVVHNAFPFGNDPAHTRIRTQVDVSCGGWPDYGCPVWGDAQRQQQARVYAGLLGACMDAPNCKSFETWGFTDAHTWLSPNGVSGDDEHPLPFDAAYTRKPAYDALAEALAV